MAKRPPKKRKEPPSRSTPAVRRGPLRALRALLALVGAGFSTWLAAMGMPASAAFAAAGVWAVWPTARRLPLAGAAVMLAGLAAIPLVGLPEYAAGINALHCRTLGFEARRGSPDCDPEDVAQGEQIARAGGPLFSARERLAVHGFNHLLALGGLAAGFPEVAWEAAAMSWTADPLPPGATAADRRAQCTERAAVGPGRERRSDSPMRSPAVRRAVAAAAAKLGQEPGSTREAGEVHFTRGGADNAGYVRALSEDSLRVALALEVPDSRLSLTRRVDGDLDVVWRGTISYPLGDYAFALPFPTVRGTRVLRVSETVFCGMQMDGAMNPYPLVWRWSLSPDDPRLGALRDTPERTWAERLAAALGGG